MNKLILQCHEHYRGIPLHALDVCYDRENGENAGEPLFNPYRFLPSGLVNCFRMHYHSAIEFIYVWDGEMTVVSGDKKYISRVGDLIIFDPYQLHNAYLDHDQTYVRYTFATWEADAFEPPAMKTSIKPYTLAAWANSILQSDTFIPVSPLSHELGALIRELPGLYLCEGDGASEFYAMSNLCRIFALLCESGHIRENKNSKISRFERDMLKFIDDHFAEEVTPEMICGQFPYNYSYFCRLFKRSFGKSFSRYLHEYRLSRAMELMHVDGHLLVSEIAARVGFSDFSYFARAFKEYVGYSPKAYIKLREHTS